MSKRERITITVRKDLLQRLDYTIDHQRIRNRSHAFEVLLSRILGNDINQAVILASGMGVNMRPFTYEIPKPLIPVNGQPLLEHTIEMLRSHGIPNIVITVSHLADKIQQYFGDGSKFGVSIRYIQEKRPSGTAGALQAAQKHLAEDPFLIMYGDVLADLDVTDLVQAHQNSKSAIGTIALTSVADPSLYGAVKLRGTRVVEFSEKPIISSDVSRLVFSGIATFDPAVFTFMQKPKRKKIFSLEQDVFPALIKDGRLYGYVFEGQWFDVSTPETYDQVLKHWQKNHA